MTDQMNLKCLGMAATAAITIVAAAAAWTTEVPTAGTLAGYLVVLVVAVLAWRLNRWRSTASALVLLVLWTVLAVVGIADLHCYASHPGASPAEPWFANPDSNTIYHASRTAAQERFSEGVYNPRSIFFGLIYMAFGPSPAPMIMACAAAIIVAVSCAGVLAGSCAGSSDADRCRISALAMALTASVCHLTAMGTVVLKDSFVIAGIALLGVTLLRFMPRREHITSGKALICGTAGILLIAALRIDYLVYVPVGLLLFLPWTLRSKKVAASLLAVAAITAGAYYAYRANLIGAQPAEYIFSNITPTRQSYNGVAEWILASPLWVRAACLPLTAAVQYLIPLPWTASADAAFGPGFQLAHISLPWYCVGGLIILSFVYWRRIPAAMLRMALFGAIIWIVPAFITAGLVNRYTLPAIPLMAPAGAYVLLHLRELPRARMLLTVYAALLLTALTLTFIFITSHLS